jgi:hypothetical protein
MFINNFKQLGPGLFHMNSINPSGIYFDSKYKNSGCNKFGTAERFNKSTKLD